MGFLYRHRVLFGIVSLAAAVVLTVGVCLFALSGTAAEAQRLTVVLDAGHGGVDGGVVGIESGKKESEINLAIVFLLQKRFEDAGFRVVLTRKTEAGLYGTATAGYKKRDMKKRAEIINANHPALVISIHQNFFSSRSRRGAQVFFRMQSPQSISLATRIQTSLNEMPECVKQSQALAGDYYILNCNAYPAVIVECGFLSNAEDEKLLLQEDYRKKISDAVAKGALSFLSSPAAGVFR